MKKNMAAINTNIIVPVSSFVIKSHAIAIPDIAKFLTVLLKVRERSSYDFLISSNFIIFDVQDFLGLFLYYYLHLVLAMMSSLVPLVGVVLFCSYFYRVVFSILQIFRPNSRTVIFLLLILIALDFLLLQLAEALVVCRHRLCVVLFRILLIVFQMLQVKGGKHIALVSVAIG